MRVIILFFALALMPSWASAQKWLEVESRVKSYRREAPDTGKDMILYPEIHFYSRREGRIVIFQSAAISRGARGTSLGWGEVITGISYRPSDGIQIEIGGGAETHRELWRTSSLLWLGNLHTQFFTIVEAGASGDWYTSVWNWNVKYVHDKDQKIESWSGVGFMAERFAGYGPRFQLVTSRGEMWYSYLLPSHGRTRRGGAMVGTRWAMQ